MSGGLTGNLLILIGIIGDLFGIIGDLFGIIRRLIGYTHLSPIKK